MAYLEFIHTLVETLDKYFENVCELDVDRIFNIGLDNVQSRKSTLCVRGDGDEWIDSRNKQELDSR